MSRTPKQRKAAAAHMRASRARRREQGYVYRHFWIHPRDWPTVKAFLKKYAPTVSVTQESK